MEERQENKMGVMSTHRLLISMSLPMMLSMLVQALYNIVDSVFVANFDQRALTAVSLSFPVQSLMIALASGTGVGINSMVSRRLGEKRFDEANKTARNGLFVEGVSSLLFVIFGIFFARPFFSFFTEDAQTVEYGVQYLSVCTILSLGIFLQIGGERLLQSTGKTVLNMVTQGIGAITNIILDPILIFGLFGMPRMGCAGAALATVIGQWVAMVLALVINAKVNRELSVSFRGFRPELRIIREIYAIGVPSIIMQAITSVMTVGMNKILGNDVAISVFGVYFKLQSFIFMPIFGLTNAVIPIVAYNFGARKKQRITDVSRFALLITVAVMAVGTLIFHLNTKTLLGFFNADAAMLEIGIPALQIISIAFCFSGVCIICASIFQALGHAFWSMIVSMIRQLVVILPAAYILMHFWGMPAVWFSLPFAELVAMLLSIFLYFKICKKTLNQL